MAQHSLTVQNHGLKHHSFHFTPTISKQNTILDILIAWVHWYFPHLNRIIVICLPCLCTISMSSIVLLLSIIPAIHFSWVAQNLSAVKRNIQFSHSSHQMLTIRYESTDRYDSVSAIEFWISRNNFAYHIVTALEIITFLEEDMFHTGGFGVGREVGGKGGEGVGWMGGGY